MPLPTSSVFVCTYQAPRELELVLAGLSRQSSAPTEVWVGDDGSGPETRAVVEAWQPRMNFALHYLWQVDDGYRKARIMNEVVRRSVGERLLFLDGDSFPHRHWVRDHMQRANGKHVLAGRRVKLGERYSTGVSVEKVLAGHFDSVLRSDLIASRMRRDTRRMSLGIRLPRPLARMLHPRPRRLMGVNFSLPRGAFFAVNGYNEQWCVYGHEDRDLEWRLKQDGHWPFRAILNQGIVFHMHHPERERTEETRRILAATESSKASRCERGLEGSEPFDAER